MTDVVPGPPSRVTIGTPWRDMPDALARICAATLQEVNRRRAAHPAETLRSRFNARLPHPRGFSAALYDALTGRIRSPAMQGEYANYGLIAEIKRASPSGGMIRADFDPPGLARSYQQGGAACLSVLTDGPFFGGSIADLQAARAACSLPVLRKDFILDEWQVHESRAIGAGCILLIMAALSDSQAVALETLARALDLDVLVEVHDRAELDRALGLQTKLIGINNRDLRTLQTDLSTTLQLAPHVPPDHIVVGESGIRSHDDVLRLRDIGVQCFLVGESLLRQDDVTLATQSLLGREPGHDAVLRPIGVEARR